MSATRHGRLMECFDAACDLAPAERAAYLAALAQADPALSEELAGLLRHDRGAGPDLGPLELLASERPLTGARGEAAAPVSLASHPDLEILQPLAEGGMGRIYLARQRSLSREVALKVARAAPPGPGEGAAGSLDRLLAEATLCGALEHPSIVPVHFVTLDDEQRPVLVMKRVEGVSWGRLLREPEHPSWAPLLRGAEDRLAVHLSILGQVCHALSFAHSRGVLHRDVKPDNVMVGAFGEVYLLDWGLACRGGAAPPLGLGTPAYLAPEMLRGGPEDERTDVYLLGATLHEALTGQPRHGGVTLLATLLAAAESAPPAYGPAVPEELADLCRRATHADRARRPSTVEAFRQELLAYQHHRAAIALSEEAQLRLQELRALLAAGTAEPQRVQALLTDCQLGFAHSLRAWPEGPRARRGQRELLITLIEQEIEGEGLARAQALLSQLEDPPEELRARVAALAEELEERRRRAVALSALERAHDWRVGARARALFFLLTGLALLALYLLAARRHGAGPGDMPGLLLSGYAGLGLLTLLGLVAIFRRALLETVVTRQLVFGTLCAIAGMCLSRALLSLPAPVTAQALSMDQLLAATASAVGGVTLRRGLWLLVPLFLAGAVVARAAPEHASQGFVCAAVLAFGTGLLVTRRSGQRLE